MASATDSVTPLPEAGGVTKHVYRNQYFGLSYPLSADWKETYQGPPPSDNGYYVLAQLRPAGAFRGPSRGTVLIAAQDLFFTRSPANNAMELIRYTKDTLKPDYQVEREPAEVSVAHHSFARLDYVSTAAGLHWRILATQIRCHMVEFVLVSRDPTLLAGLIQDMNKMTLPAEAGATIGTGGGDLPVCIKDFATGEHVTHRVDPALAGRFNPIPVRIIIDRLGRVRHIHLISAFPDQARSITTALSQWTFTPYLHNGRPVEVETGIMFGLSQRQRRPPATSPARPPTNVTN